MDLGPNFKIFKNPGPFFYLNFKIVDSFCCFFNGAYELPRLPTKSDLEIRFFHEILRKSINNLF